MSVTTDGHLSFASTSKVDEHDLFCFGHGRQAIADAVILEASNVGSLVARLLTLGSRGLIRSFVCRSEDHLQSILPGLAGGSHPLAAVGFGEYLRKGRTWATVTDRVEAVRTFLEPLRAGGLQMQDAFQFAWAGYFHIDAYEALQLPPIRMPFTVSEIRRSTAEGIRRRIAEQGPDVPQTPRDLLRRVAESLEAPFRRSKFECSRREYTGFSSLFRTGDPIAEVLCVGEPSRSDFDQRLVETSHGRFRVWRVPRADGVDRALAQIAQSALPLVLAVDETHDDPGPLARRLGKLPCDVAPGGLSVHLTPVVAAREVTWPGSERVDALDWDLSTDSVFERLRVAWSPVQARVAAAPERSHHTGTALWGPSRQIEATRRTLGQLFALATGETAEPRLKGRG